MINKLLAIYKDELSLRKVIVKFVKWEGMYIHLILMSSLFILMIDLTFLFSTPQPYLIFIIIFLIFLAFMKLLNIEIKRIYQEKYNGMNYSDIRYKRLITFLKDEGLYYAPDKIKLLCELIDKKTEESKIPFLIGKGTIVTILLPIWMQLIIWIFTKELKDIEKIIAFSLVLILFIVGFLALISVFKNVIYDEFINENYKRLKLISNDLKELLLKI